MRIRILTENTVYRRGLTGEHGLSFLLEEQGHRFLFDTGQSSVYVKNAEKLHEDIKNVDGIILSHGHYDHCGGIEFYPRSENMPPIYIREKAFEDKRNYNGKKNQYDRIGIDWAKEKFAQSYIFTGKRYEICKNFTLLSKIEDEAGFKNKPRGFYIGEGERPDYMEDEQILVVQTEKGLSLFMGCSHMGVMNCISRVMREFPGQPVYSILAGMHLNHASMEQIDKTIEELEKIAFDILIPVHCTGIRAIGRMKERLGERCILAETGKEIKL